MRWQGQLEANHTNIGPSKEPILVCIDKVRSCGGNRAMTTRRITCSLREGRYPVSTHTVHSISLLDDRTSLEQQFETA